jgi:hypothetical protein
MSKKKNEKEETPKKADANDRIDKLIAYLRKHTGDNNEIRDI